MDVRLPAALQAAITAAAVGRAGADLAAGAGRLSRGYRERMNSADVVVSAEDAAAYALSRLPATYAASMAALSRLAEALFDFAPATLLDLGAGPGTASWAAAAIFPMLDRITLVERSRPFLDLARRLAAAGPPAVAGADLRAADLASPEALAGESADLAVLAYALTELSEEAATALVCRLLAGRAQVVAIVEPGTPRDHRRLMAVRAAALAAGARVLAPCPHASACPLPAGDWCHFSVRLPRRRDHMRLKGGTVPFEDEPYAYLLLAAADAKVTPAAPASRILRRPEEGKPALCLRLCRPDGRLGAACVPRRDKAAFRAARRLSWGDGFSGQ